MDAKASEQPNPHPRNIEVVHDINRRPEPSVEAGETARVDDAANLAPSRNFDDGEAERFGPEEAFLARDEPAIGHQQSETIQ